MEEIWRYLTELWTKFWGRKQSTEQHSFLENEIVSPAYIFRVSYLTQAMYLNLHPTVYAISISPSGDTHRLESGYNSPLSPGRYLLHFVDRQIRKSAISKTTEVTIDGVTLSLTPIITYQVSDPIKALQISHPIENLLSLIQSDLKEYIQTHEHREILGNNTQIVQFIKQRYDSHFPISKLFSITDIVIQEWVKEFIDELGTTKKQIAKAFISYSHEDTSFMEELVRSLKRKGIRVWGDFEDLTGGQDWQKEIQRAILECQYFLVILTPDAVESEWVSNEIAYASKKGKFIIPLHLKECDIPISLIRKQYIDFEKRTKESAFKELLEILNKQNIKEQ